MVCYLCIWPLKKKMKKNNFIWNGCLLRGIDVRHCAANKPKIDPFLSHDFKHFGLQTKDIKCLICWNATTVGWLFSLHSSKYDFFFLYTTPEQLNTFWIIVALWMELVAACLIWLGHVQTVNWVSDYNQSMQKKNCVEWNFPTSMVDLQGNSDGFKINLARGFLEDL